MKRFLTRRLSPRQARTAGRPSIPLSFCPRLERLEGRDLLAAVSWTGLAGDGLWSSANNWSTQAEPTAADDVTIGNDATVTINFGANIRSLQSSGALTLRREARVYLSANSELGGSVSFEVLSEIQASNAAVVNLSGAKTIDGARFIAWDSTIKFPSLTGELDLSRYGYAELTASGKGGRIELPGVTKASHFLRLFATEGATIDASGLAEFSGTVEVVAAGQGGIVDLSALTKLETSGSSLRAVEGGSILCGKLTNLDRVQLTVGQGGTPTSQITSVTNGFLSVTGGSPEFSGLADISGSDLYVSDHGTLRLPNVTVVSDKIARGNQFRYRASGPGSRLELPDLTQLLASDSTFGYSLSLEALEGATLEAAKLGEVSDVSFYATADGAGSVVSLPVLTQLAATESYFSFRIDASQGGTIDLSQVTEISGGRVSVSSSGQDSKIQLSKLSKLSGNSGTLKASGGGTILNERLVNLEGVTLSIEQGSLSTSQIASMVNAELKVASGTPDFSGLTQFKDSKVLVSGGARLALPNLKSEPDANKAFGNSQFEVRDLSSSLELPGLTQLRNSDPQAPERLEFTAGNGGKIDLSNLTEISQVATDIKVEGNTSVVRLPNLNRWVSKSSSLSARADGELMIGRLTGTDGVTIFLGSPNVSTSQMTSITNGSITVTGVIEPDLNALTNVSNTSLFATLGAKLRLPGVTGVYHVGDQSPDSFFIYFNAVGLGSRLELPGLTEFRGNGSPNTLTIQLNVWEGATIDLPSLKEISQVSTRILASDSGNINLPSLSKWSGKPGSLDAIFGGVVRASKLTSLDGVNLSISEGSLSISQLTSFKNGTLSAVGGTSDFSGLTDVTHSKLFAERGSTLRLPNLKGVYDLSNSTGTVVFSATGAGSRVELPGLTEIRQTAPDATTRLEVRASNGGTVDLPNLTKISNATVTLFSTDQGSVISVPDLTQWSGKQGGLWTANRGVILNGKLASLDGVYVGVRSGQISTSQIASMMNGVIQVEFGTPDFSGLTALSNTSLNVSRGGKLRLPNLKGLVDLSTSSENITFSVVDTGSSLELPSVTEIRSVDPTSPFSFEMSSWQGGVIDLSSVTKIAQGRSTVFAFDPNSRIHLTSLGELSGPGSQLQMGNRGIVNTGPQLRLGAGTVFATSNGSGPFNSSLTTGGAIGFTAFGASSMSFGNNLELTDTAELRIRADGTGIDSINVQGTAKLAGDVVFSTESRTYALGFQWTIISASSASGTLRGGRLQRGRAQSGDESFVTTAATDKALVLFVGLAGDANLDGDVDVNDFVQVRKNFGKTQQTLAQGDLDGSGTVDINDFVLLRANFGRTGPAFRSSADLPAELPSQPPPAPPQAHREFTAAAVVGAAYHAAQSTTENVARRGAHAGGRPAHGQVR